MFCEVCGQLIEHVTENLPGGSVTYLIHSTAETYPGLNDHEPKMSKHDKERYIARRDADAAVRPPV